MAANAPRPFERARNVDPTRWAGDPERWGGAVQFVGQSNQDGSPLNARPFYGPQVLRVQARDLLAIGWDFVARWDVSGLVADDAGSLALEVTLGTGQATTILHWQIATFAGGVGLVANQAAEALAWSAPLGATRLPYWGFASIPAGATGPVAFAPAVPLGYRLHAANVSVANLATARIGALYVMDSTSTQVGAAISIASIVPDMMPAPFDWVNPIEGDTPTIACTTAVPAGESIDVALLGTLERVGLSGVAVSSSPLVACSINARPVLQMASPTIASHNISVRVTAHCAPRSWVP
jgi:hypothetical protein